MIDTEVPSLSINLNKLFKLDPATQISLRNKSPTQLHFYNPTSKLLQSVEVTSRAVTVVAEGVLGFKAHGDEPVVYVTGPDATSPNAKVNVRDQGQNYYLRDLPIGGTYLLDVARFNGGWHFAVGSTADGKVYVYKDPVKILGKSSAGRPLPSAVLRVENPASLSFSLNTRFVAVQGGQHFAVYDIESNRQFRYEIKEQLRAKPAVWMDGHRLATTSNGLVYVFDFDGANQQKLLPHAEGLDAIFSVGYDFLYTISNSAAVTGRGALSRNDLVL